MGRRNAVIDHASGETWSELLQNDVAAPGESADAAEARRFLRRHVARIVTWGLPAALFDMTLDARLQAIDVALDTPAIDEPVRFHMRGAGADGDAFAFDVTYVDEQRQSVTVREWVAQTDHGWKIVRVA